MRFGIGLLFLLLPAPAFANLLRNGDFQDDWITLLPETKNHHWCFPSEFFNRRDYNPDGWFCKGAWDWENADGPWGERRLVIGGPAELCQRVNWIAIHDDRQLGGFPDAGGFPIMKGATSRRPDRLVRDLTFRVLLSGADVPKGAGSIEIGLHPPTGLATGDPMGDRNKPTVVSSVPVPEGTYKPQWIEVKLAAADWRKSANKKGDETDLPALASVAIRYTAKAGKLVVARAELLAEKNNAPNLLPHGGFEILHKDGFPAGWSRPIKYRYFPPRHYYIFNTWHSTTFPNRGLVEVDRLLVHSGKHSLRMIVPSGDETAVVSEPIPLHQKEARLIEVTAWIKTDRLCMLQIDGHDEKGNRLDGFNFIHKAPVSIGTDGWRMIRQVFRPRTPVQALKLVLAARGVNGYTLDDTGMQPQNNVVGTIWWDDVRVTEPESDAGDLQGRGVNPATEFDPQTGLRIVELDLGERLYGENTLRAVVENPGPARKLTLRWEVGERIGAGESLTLDAGANGRTTFTIPYRLVGDQLNDYQEFKGRLTLLDADAKPIASSELWTGTWRDPIDIELGALYLRPEQKQFVRLNLGIARKTLATVRKVRLALSLPTKRPILHVDLDATPEAFAGQRAKIPVDLRDDFSNLLLADLDVSSLPVQPFHEPERQWWVQVLLLDANGKAIKLANSPRFCRLAHDVPQPPIKEVVIRQGMTFVNGKPWMPFGVTYGHTPAYDGPADPGKYRDLRNLPAWSMYDRHSNASSNRKEFDFNCLRYVAGSITKLDQLEKRWQGDNLYCSSAFAIPTHAFSLKDLFKLAGGQDKLDAYLDSCKVSPKVVSVAPGIEEAFGLFQGASPDELKGLEQVVDYLRKKSGRPVMVGHGGYWNRLEFEKAPFFDIFDPETEPLYPANLHTDLVPLVSGKDKAIWLRPQMYESIPFERWRFHTYVELMRGCRGWQIAHGPGDASLFRGLHGEMEFWKSIVASTGEPPRTRIEPWIEHKAWSHQGKTYLIAASTHGMMFGHADAGNPSPGTERGRKTQGRNELRDETNAYGIGAPPESGAAIHGIQYLPYARVWPKGTVIRQWIKLDGDAMPGGIAILVKADGRWTHAVEMGKIDWKKLRDDPKAAYWFLNAFYRHAKGFLGWGTDLVGKSLDYIPKQAKSLGALPKPGQWHELTLSLEEFEAAGKLVDGIGFLHENGVVTWGRTEILEPKGPSWVMLEGEKIIPPERLDFTKIYVAGLKEGARVRVLFEDRTIVAQDGYFVDNFRGADLYQRHGGTSGYGNVPVALHLYEIPGP